VLDKAAAAVVDFPYITALLDALEHPEIRFGDNAGTERDALLMTTLRDAYEDAEKLPLEAHGVLNHNACVAFAHRLIMATRGFAAPA
jgi:hypothetical protein